MPFAVKHKTSELYLCGTKSKLAKCNEIGLVDLDFAQIYATREGAEKALASWAKYSVSGLIDKDKYNLVKIVKVNIIVEN